MAIAGTNLVASGSTTDATSFTTASISPASNALLLLTVSYSPASGSAAPTITGNGLTWTPVGGGEYGGAGSRRLVRVWRAMGASPSSGAVTIDFGAISVESLNWSVDQFTGVDTSGTNGSGAIVQSVQTINATTSTSLTLNLAAFGAAGNASFGVFSHAGAETFTPDADFTALCNRFVTTRNLSLLTEWRLADDDPTATWATSSIRGGVAAEIKAGASDFPLDAQDDAYTVSGTDAAVVSGRVVSSDPATYSWVGVLAELILGRLVSSDPGAYTVTGLNADLVYAAAGEFTVDASAGSFTVTGTNASTVAGRAIDIAPGAYAVTGTTATFESAVLPAFPAGPSGYIADYGQGRIREPVEVVTP